MDGSTLNGSNPGDYVLEVRPHDVLFGRGSGPNDHEGNIKFRDLVAQRKQEYMATNHRQTKAKIAKSIVDQIFAVNGRFLKKLEPNEVANLGYTNGEDVYQVVGDDIVMEKAKQALRQNRNREEGGGNSPKPDKTAMTVPSSFHGTMPELARAMSNASGGNGNNLDGPIFQPPPVRADATRSTGIATHLHHELLQPLPMTVPMEHIPDSFGMYGQQQQQQQQQQLQPQSMYSHDDGYATYTTSLDDPEEQQYFTTSNPAGRSSIGGRGYPSSAAAAVTAPSGPRRSLLGGRKGEIAGLSGATAVAAPTGNRRESLQFQDVWRRESLVGGLGRATESMQMSELMESFKGMSTTGDLNSSTDTIGTIDNLMGMGGASMANMSGISNMSTMSMGSTTSLFKMTPELATETLRNNNNGGVGGPSLGVERIPSNDDMKFSGRQNRMGQSPGNDYSNWGGGGAAVTRPNQSQIPEHRVSLDVHSLGGSDLWNSRQINWPLDGSSALMRAPLEGSSALLRAPLEGSSNMSFRNFGQNSTLGSTTATSGFMGQYPIFENNSTSPNQGSTEQQE